MKKLLVLFGLLLQLGVAQAQTYYTFYEVRDYYTNMPVNNYPLQFRYTSGASGTISSVTGLDPLNPGWITFYGNSSSICGNIETVNPSATIVGSIWSCLANPGPNNFIRVKNTNSTSFKINGSSASTSSGSPTTIIYCDVRSLTWTNGSWYGPNISSSTLKIYNYTSGIEVPITSNSYGSGGAPASIDLTGTGYIGTSSGKYRIELSNNFSGTVITYNAYIEIRNGSAAISGTYQTKANNAASTPRVTTPFGPYTDTPSKTGPSSYLTIGRNSSTFSITSNTDVSTGSAVCSMVVHIDAVVLFGSSFLMWSNDVISPIPYSNNCTSMVPVAYSMGDFLDNNGDPFFSSTTNAPDGSLWRLRIELFTPCGTVQRALPFRIGARPTATTSGYMKEAGAAEQDANSIKFAPMPFTNKLSSILQLAENSTVSLNVYGIDGRLIATPYLNSDLQAGTAILDLETASWPSGIYLYECIVNGERMTGKIIK